MVLEISAILLMLLAILGISGMLVLGFRTYLAGNHVSTPDAASVAGNRRCQNCQQPVAATAQFCSGCGQPVAQEFRCPQCNTEVGQDDLFCGSCGKDLQTAQPASTPTDPVKFEQAWIWGALVAAIVSIILIGIDSEDGLGASVLAIIPLTTCLLAFFRPMPWGNTASVVLLLHNLAILSGALTDPYGNDVIEPNEGLPIVLTISGINALVCVGIGLLRLRNRRPNEPATPSRAGNGTRNTL